MGFYGLLKRLHAHIVRAAFQRSTTELFLLNKGEVIRKSWISKDKVFRSLGVRESKAR
jgi:hypothetical protein